MNTTSKILAAIIVILLVIGGIYYAKQQPDMTGPNLSGPNGTSTVDGTGNPNPQTPNPNNPNPQVPMVAEAPAVTTAAKTFPTDTAVTVTGGVIPNGAPTNYWFEYGLLATMGSKTTVQNVGSGFIIIPTPTVITGLKANTTYYYQLVAQNQYGIVKGAQYSFKTTVGTPARTGSAPKVFSVAANGVSSTTANINGTIDPNSNETQYWFEYGTSTKLGNISVLTSVGSGTASKSVSHTITNLQPGTTYYFRVNAQNDFGTVNGKTMSFKTSGSARR